MDLTPVAATLRLQDGVVSRAQALASGIDDDDVERLLRRHELARIHPGVYVDHTGPASWSQRAWAAVLYHWPAALAGPSALRAHGLRAFAEPGCTPTWSRPIVRADGSEAREPVHVVVDARRRLAPPPGVVLTRRRNFEERALLHLSPPRLRLDEALLDVASACADEASAVAVLADACQQGATTAARLHATLVTRGRLQGRRLLLDVLADVASGAMSVLERRYLREVERAHGLPIGRRQVRVVTRRGVTFRDVEHPDLGVVVELDGRFVHTGRGREWSDLERDVDAMGRGEVTLRLGWVHVLDPCRASLLVGRLLGARGWTGSPRPCGAACGVTARPWVA